MRHPRRPAHKNKRGLRDAVVILESIFDKKGSEQASKRLYFTSFELLPPHNFGPSCGCVLGQECNNWLLKIEFHEWIVI